MQKGKGEERESGPLGLHLLPDSPYSQKKSKHLLWGEDEQRSSKQPIFNDMPCRVLHLFFSVLLLSLAIVSRIPIKCLTFSHGRISSLFCIFRHHSQSGVSVIWQAHWSGVDWSDSVTWQTPAQAGGCNLCCFGQKVNRYKMARDSHLPASCLKAVEDVCVCVCVQTDNKLGAFNWNHATISHGRTAR